MLRRIGPLLPAPAESPDSAAPRVGVVLVELPVLFDAIVVSSGLADPLRGVSSLNALLDSSRSSVRESSRTLRSSSLAPFGSTLSTKLEDDPASKVDVSQVRMDPLALQSQPLLSLIVSQSASSPSCITSSST